MINAESTNQSKDIRLEVILKEYLALAPETGSKAGRLTNAFIKTHDEFDFLRIHKVSLSILAPRPRAELFNNFLQS